MLTLGLLTLRLLNRGLLNRGRPQALRPLEARNTQAADIASAACVRMFRRCAQSHLNQRFQEPSISSRLASESVSRYLK